MKALIVIANIVLVLLLAAAALPLFKPETPIQSAVRSGAKDKQKTKGGAKSGSRSGVKDKAKSKDKLDSAGKGQAASVPVTPKSREEQKNTILDADIFNAERTPNAAFGRGNSRVELALVGTIEAGKYRAAIILQRTNTRQVNPFMRMMWGGAPGGGPGGPGGRGARRFGMGPGGPGGQSRNNPAVIKQYVKVGETMPNGYKLTTLSRTRATLTRGGDKMELELQAPSKNQNARRAPQRLNANQQLQQAQLMTQQMMVRALMDMRNSGGGNRGGGNRGGGNRGGRR